MWNVVKKITCYYISFYKECYRMIIVSTLKIFYTLVQVHDRAAKEPLPVSTGLFDSQIST